MLKTVSTQLALASDTLPEVLAKGNTTGGTDLAVSAGDDITLADNSKVIFGAGPDLSIYSDGATGQVSGNVNVTGTFGTSGAATFSAGITATALTINTAVAPAVVYQISGVTQGITGIAQVTNGGVTGTVIGDGFTRVLAGKKHWWSVDDGVTAAMVIDASGNLSTAGNVVLANGKGIDFSATAGTGTSELLDDYEEGVWTPTIFGSSTAGTYELSANTSCTYVKIGDLVTIIARIYTDSAITAGGTGNIRISGLPFSMSGSIYGSPFCGITSGIAFTGSYISIERISQGATTSLYVNGVDNAGTQTQIPISNVGTSDVLAFQFTYRV
jgi:hypothetical protein